MGRRDLKKWGRWLENRWPAAGSLLQRKAVQRLSEDLSPEGIPYLVKALAVPDRKAAIMADHTLRSLRPREDRECIDVLCGLAMSDPGGAAAKICIATGKRPSDPAESCLFLVVTRQLDAYFQEDDQFQGLSLAYEGANRKIKARVLDIIRSGDRRFEGFFTSRRELQQCSEREILIFLEYALRQGNWPRLFKAFLELPLKYGYPLLEHFRTSGWEPEDPELKSLYSQALVENSGEAFPGRAATTPSIFDRWLEEGESGKWDRASPQELLSRLKEADPPEGAGIVAALAKKGTTEEIAATVQSSPHWLVRLAGHRTGMVGHPAGEAQQDRVFWVRELAEIGNVLEFRPDRATPADVERLATAPPKAFTGKLGAVRRVLRLLVNRQVEVGVHEPMVIEADETAAMMERAD